MFFSTIYTRTAQKYIQQRLNKIKQSQRSSGHAYYHYQLGLNTFITVTNQVLAFSTWSHWCKIFNYRQNEIGLKIFSVSIDLRSWWFGCKSPVYHVSQYNCCHVSQSPCCHVSQLPCWHVSQSPCCHVSQLPCFHAVNHIVVTQSTTLLSCESITLLSCQSITLLSCQSITLLSRSQPPCCHV